MRSPAEVLPHRPPFLFLDEVTVLAVGNRAEGYWQLNGSEAFFAGHFPGRPTLPGVLMAEAIAQLGAYVVLSDERFVGKLPLFGGLDSARFRRQVTPKERLDLSIEMTRMSTRAGRGQGQALVAGELACEVELFFVVVDDDSKTAAEGR
ncbi:MAG: beta-hydroxyacyl-ACP dehydratase [Acidimicrobiia bacterium]|nr:beta-hydroxyacyl-ACP dehydratase [Acidimicrobiia bacterium]MYC57199.1 beta-hydroxyacyl-ACP dehydratase [Acidimicrobiia bacterium]MYI29877.1 beta-hydroxyacyl-ACP dehydratase [Acidimicrobiia bacterium]